jgi:hypothetical protein
VSVPILHPHNLAQEFRNLLGTILLPRNMNIHLYGSNLVARIKVGFRNFQGIADDNKSFPARVLYNINFLNMDGYFFPSKYLEEGVVA